MTQPESDFDFHYCNPRSDHGLAHNPLQAIIGPRPIDWISSASVTGARNLAPYSFFNLFRPSPPILGFSSGGRKDSLCNIEETGQFVWNLVTAPLASAINLTSAVVEPDVDEFLLAGLSAAPSTLPGTRYVGQSPVSFDCILTGIVDLTDRDGRSSGSYLVLGEVVHIRIARHLLRDGIYETLAAEPILRGGGTGDYFGISAENHFHMVRPQS
jgi:flavin reductase (DIM6/NTAB) family NADH-FMN oxidoreductase RutF